MFGEHTSTILMVAGLALASFVLLRGSLGRWGRPRSKGGETAEVRRIFGERSRDTALADAPAEVLRWQVEMHETARDLKAELDSKLAAMQALIAMARQERNLLETAIERAQGLGIDPLPGALTAIARLGDPAALEDPQYLAQVATRMPTIPGNVPSDVFDRDRTSLAISRLVDQGLTPRQIAEQLGLPLGEIEFLLNLRNA